MKRLAFLFLALSGFITANAQFTLEHSYPGMSANNQSCLQLANLGNNEYKYYFTDYNTNQLKLFNLNHTPYATVTVPVTLINQGENIIKFVTRTLFDCDTTKFEYVVMPTNGLHNFYVFREDGTNLFQRDSTYGAFDLAMFGYTFNIRTIMNTPSGTKLFLYKFDQTTSSLPTTDVYSLCGTLPESVIDLDAASASYVNVFPNPSSSTTQFQFNFPANIKKFQLTILNSIGQVIHTSAAIETERSYNFDGTNLSSGIYFYMVTSENKTIQNGKFIITNK